jgi:hypothetical protein
VYKNQIQTCQQEKEKKISDAIPSHYPFVSQTRQSPRTDGDGALPSLADVIDTLPDWYHPGALHPCPNQNHPASIHGWSFVTWKSASCGGAVRRQRQPLKLPPETNACLERM